MAPWVKGLLLKHEDLSLDFQHLHKVRTAVHVCNLALQQKDRVPHCTASWLRILFNKPSASVYQVLRLQVLVTKSDLTIINI